MDKIDESFKKIEDFFMGYFMPLKELIDLKNSLDKDNEEEKELYTKQLGDVLKYVDQMNEVDTSNVKPMTQVIDFVNVMREDVPHQEISKEALMSNAPDEENGFFKVPKIN